MGLATAILLTAIVCAIGIFSRPVNIVYALIFVIAFFEEIGAGFTSDTASLFFNQEYMNFLNFKAYEFIIAGSYLYVLLTYRTQDNSNILKFERKLLYTFLVVVTSVMLTEYIIHNNANVGAWRLLISGMLLLHLMRILIDTEEKFLQFIKVLVWMMAISASVGLVKYAAGYGILSPRGMTPFFWDDGLIAGFSLVSLILIGYQTGYSTIADNQRIFSRTTSMILLFILLITVALCFRRTLWIVTLGGTGLILYFSGKLRVQHYIAIAALCVALVTILTLPNFHDTRDKLIHYANSMNVFRALSKQSSSELEASTATHIYNTQQYIRIISEEPVILVTGLAARSGPDYDTFEGEGYLEGPLGTPHNAILATIVFFGAVAATVYLLLYLGPIVSIRKVIAMDEHSVYKYLALGAWAMILMELIPALTFVPGFYTTVKGCFVTFTSIFIFRYSMYYGTTTRPIDTDSDHGLEHHDRTDDRILSRKKKLSTVDA